MCDSTVTYCRKAFEAPQLSAGVVGAAFSAPKSCFWQLLLQKTGNSERLILLLQLSQMAVTLAVTLGTIDFLLVTVKEKLQITVTLLLHSCYIKCCDSCVTENPINNFMSHR